ncbi:hypothetical protein EG329_014318 [Mollisiaceae sp. DMI_Dod_QoI]|nr:hypothetical protein EG329_014318 [Helotiales sp. DMI_Dod_QoI]
MKLIGSHCSFAVQAPAAYANIPTTFFQRAFTPQKHRIARLAQSHQQPGSVKESATLLINDCTFVPVAIRSIALHAGSYRASIVQGSLKAILDPSSSPDQIRKLHQQDETTKWFGVSRSEQINPVTGKCAAIFRDYGRYATLMAETRPSNGTARYPQLVSFIGQTNAGKSTLIKMLISHGKRKLGPCDLEFPSPVAGATKNDKVPTSGDVHLYADPATIETQFPMLYADCEGLEGGEEAPLAHQIQTKDRPSALEEGKKFVIGGAKRVLEWARDDITSGREYAVRHLYPRLLYTFSDVIVFVLRNAKTFESVALKLLLDWAASSLEKSINQPILPHAVIVFNATDVQVDEDEWDVEKATKNLMSTVRNAIHKVPVFREYVELWSRRGKRIKTIEDLIKCYYSSISVVRIPAKGRYMLIDAQINKLHDQISLKCEAAFHARERVRMLPHADELNEYLEAGFKHFSKRLDVPFNFVEIAVRNHPVPQNFGDHVSNLAVALQKRHRYQDATIIFEALSPFVASCLLLDAVRGRRPGKIIGGDTLGWYQSNFSSDSYGKKWINLIMKDLTACEERLQQRRHSAGSTQYNLLETEDAFHLHVEEKLRVFFRVTGGAEKYTSLATCYCCLMNVPEHPLPCGHVLCTPCIKGYGKKLEHSSVRVEACPLHPEESERYGPWIIRFKPDFAGVRVLSLDGGGVRGIVELEVLRAIENALGGKIPVQRFFDLIVGTSTGGIVALGIGAKHWSVRESIDKFTALCDQAFTPREFDDVQGINKIVTLRHGSRFKTKPLHRGLNTAFGEQYLFGGEQESDTAYMTKVAVTSTSGTGQNGLIITNYGRQDERQLTYRVEFSLGSRPGLKVWQAAAATSAAPSFFKPFKHPRADRSYMDGALYYNNPIKIANNERKLLWSDVAESHPDIMLSIGTGQNLQETMACLRSGARSQNEQEKQKTARGYGKMDAAEKKVTSRTRRIFRAAGNVKNFFNVLVNRIDNVLDAELAWRDFTTDVRGPDRSGAQSDRYIRINPDLKTAVPPIYAKEELKSLQMWTINNMASPANKARIRGIADRLVASSFYFEKGTAKESQPSEGWKCPGKIYCRFENGSTEIRELGRYLRNKQSGSFQPYFTVRDSAFETGDQLKLLITPEKLDAMIERAHFDMDRFDIHISSRSAATNIALCLAEPEPLSSTLNCISGFPRTLITEDKLKEERLERRRTAAKARARPGMLQSRSAPATVPEEPVVTQIPELASLERKTTFQQIIKRSTERLVQVETRPPRPSNSILRKEPRDSDLINLMDDDPNPAEAQKLSPTLPFAPSRLDGSPLNRPRSLPTNINPSPSHHQTRYPSEGSQSHQTIPLQRDNDGLYADSDDDAYRPSHYGEVEEDRHHGFEEYNSLSTAEDAFDKGKGIVVSQREVKGGELGRDYGLGQGHERSVSEPEVRGQFSNELFYAQWTSTQES